MKSPLFPLLFGIIGTTLVLALAYIVAVAWQHPPAPATGAVLPAVPEYHILLYLTTHQEEADRRLNDLARDGWQVVQMGNPTPLSATEPPALPILLRREKK